MNTDTPNNESVNEIEEYLNNRSYYYDYSVLIEDTIFYKLHNLPYALNLYKVEHGTNASYVQLRIYNSNGAFVNGYTNCYGDLSKLNILEEYPSKQIKHLPNNKDLTFKNELELFSISPELKGKLIDQNKEWDYTYVVYWNIHTNYYSKVLLKEITKFKEKHSDKNIGVILVNNAFDEV